MVSAPVSHSESQWFESGLRWPSNPTAEMDIWLLLELGKEKAVKRDADHIALQRGDRSRKNTDTNTVYPSWLHGTSGLPLPSPIILFLNSTTRAEGTQCDNDGDDDNEGTERNNTSRGVYIWVAEKTESVQHLILAPCGRRMTLFTFAFWIKDSLPQRGDN